MLRFEIKRASPFKDLFTIRDEVVKRICDNMRQFGFDSSKPLVIWKGRGGILIDGYTRLVAAELANIREIPVIEKEFDNENQALDYAIDCQRNRRNLSEQEIFKCISERDKRKDKNANLKQNQVEAQDCASHEKSGNTSGSIFLNSGKTAETTANLIGISTRKVERARSVLDNAPEEIKEAIRNGDMTINSAYNKIDDLRKNKNGPSERKEDENRKIKKVVRSIRKRFTREQIEKLIRLLQEEK